MQLRTNTNLGYICFTLKGVADDVTLIDTMQDKLQGEVLDLQHASLFLKTPKITAARGKRSNLRLSPPMSFEKKARIGRTRGIKERLLR